MKPCVACGEPSQYYEGNKFEYAVPLVGKTGTAHVRLAGPILCRECKLKAAKTIVEYLER